MEINGIGIYKIILRIFFVLLLFSFLGCTTIQKDSLSSTECVPFVLDKERLINDIKTVGLIAIVELTEGHIAGNFPIEERGVNIKNWAVLEKRVYTRRELGLRGKVIRFLKGHSERDIQFDILMENLIADRNGIVLSQPGSNIPDLVIGNKYLIMMKEFKSKELYYT